MKVKMKEIMMRVNKFLLTAAAAVMLSSVFATAKDYKPAAWDVQEPPLDVPAEYEVYADGKKIKLYAVRIAFNHDRLKYHDVPNLGGIYWFGSFPCTKPVEVTVKSTAGTFEKVQMLPAGKAPQFTRKGEDTLKFTASKPFKLAIERDGRTKPLILFGNGEEKLPPRNAPNTVWFGPGVHRPGLITLKTGQTLVIESGAIVCGAVKVEGDDVTVCGYGILTGCIYPRYRGPIGFGFLVDKSRRVKIRGITIADAYSWALCVRNSDTVTIEDVRICGSRTLCDDGFDVWNSSNVTLRDSFIRAQDDNVAVKGRTDDRPAPPCENILVERCTMWVDGANVIRIGFESDASIMRNIVIRDCDVLHYGHTNPPAKEFWSHAIIWLQASGGMPIADSVFEDIRVNSDGRDQYLVIANPRLTWRTTPKYAPKLNGGNWTFYDKAGSVSNCVFRNISVSGNTKGKFPIFIEGKSPTENVHGLSFDGVKVFGRDVDRSYPGLHIGKHSDAIIFRK